MYVRLQFISNWFLIYFPDIRKIEIKRLNLLFSHVILNFDWLWIHWSSEHDWTSVLSDGSS